MLRRSVLFAPGDRPAMCRKALEAGADAVVFDLEDAVAPARKETAREAVRDVLSEIDDSPCEVFVRVNASLDGIDDGLDGGDDGLDAAAADLDVVLTVERPPDGLVLPKASGAADVEALDRLVDERGTRGGTLPILALVETATGVLEAPAIAAATPTDALVFGAEDLAADLGATRTAEGLEVLYARERVVVAASAAGVDAIDTVYTDLEDAGGLTREARVASQFGFDGKLAIHPAQVEPIHDAFAPTDDEIAWAERVLEARERAAAEGRGVFRVDGEMVDAPAIARAERVVERAGARRPR